jgi:hypothetical protein
VVTRLLRRRNQFAASLARFTTKKLPVNVNGVLFASPSGTVSGTGRN